MSGIAILLTCSLSMTVIAMVLAVISVLFVKCVSAKWLYYSWIAVLIGFLIPIRVTTSRTPIKSGVITLDEIINGQFSEIPAEKTQAYIGLLFAIWILGCMILMVVKLLKNYHYNSTIKRIDPAPNFIQSQCNEISKELHIKKSIEVVTCEIATTPMLIGLFNPRIVIPTEITDERNLEIYLIHELTHYKSKDNWIKFLLAMVGSIHWFNPFVIMLRKAINCFCELACDEMVLKKKSEHDRIEYGKSLLFLIKKQQKLTGVLGTNFVGGNRFVVCRVEMICKAKRGKVGVIFFLCIVVAAILTGGVSLNKNYFPPVVTQHHLDELASDNILRVTYVNGSDSLVFWIQPTDDRSRSIIDMAKEDLEGLAQNKNIRLPINYADYIEISEETDAQLLEMMQIEQPAQT